MKQSIPIPNPYDVLQVSPEASNKEITIAFTVAMKNRQYPLNAIAIARKSLINPQERIIADYLRPVLTTIQRFKPSDFSALNSPAPDIKFLPEFDSLEREIADRDRISASDRRLGQALFS